MTTKVKIEFVSGNRPVEVKVQQCRVDGENNWPVSVSKILKEVGDSFEDYVHTFQRIIVEEI